ncbi:MAG TPA: macrolide transporter [Deltaproteobacteria bacterium]|nr:macrolide transporter [Deltaproteobacteria bacterium]
MRPKKLFWTALLLIAAGLSFFVWKWLQKKNQQPVFTQVEVVRGDLEINVLATGVVQPENRLELKPPIAGRVESIRVQEGERVQRGQILAWLSSSERAALLDAARAKGAAELARWQGLFKPTPLLAPLDGLIIVKSVVPGQVVTATDVVLVMSDHLIVNTQVDETDIGQIKVGQAAQINLDAYPKDFVSGKVIRIGFESKTVNNVTIYEVEVLPEQVPDFMRSGMTANVKFTSDFRKDVLLVPAEAVRREAGKTSVLIPNPARPSQNLSREIRVGLSDGKKMEVLSGLSEGESVLIPVLPKIAGTPPRPTNPFSPIGGGHRR